MRSFGVKVVVTKPSRLIDDNKLINSGFDSDFCTAFQPHLNLLIVMRFASFPSFALLAIVPLLFTSCTPDTWAPALEEPLPFQTPQPDLVVALSSVSLLQTPADGAAISWALSLPDGSWVEGLYALNPEGESLTFDGFDPMVLGEPNLPHTLHIRLRHESNHVVTYSEVSAFAFTPADALASGALLGKPGNFEAFLEFVALD